MKIFQHAEIDQPNADIFHKKVFIPLTMLTVIKYIVLAIGITLLMTVIGLMVYKQYKVGDLIWFILFVIIIFLQKNTTVVEIPVANTDETTPLITS